MKLYARTVLLFAGLLLAGCDGKTSSANEDKDSENIQHAVEALLANMVPVSSGTFLMGDFGPLVGEKLPFSINSDNKNLHAVNLSDFMISKYKVTYGDYDVYRTATKGDELSVSLSKRYPGIIAKDVSASVTWQQAKSYCLWLGKVSGKKVDLPTEAQWEYAARSRGEYLPYATSTGDFKLGVNVPNEEQRQKMIGVILPYYPIGRYPPNPLGLYDMGLSGREWTNDWYAEEYYWRSPKDNPKGPDNGTKKVLRGYIGGDSQSALTMFRQSALPIPLEDDENYERDGISPGYVFRCVINL